jgi:tRNA (adenine37-N6)-methyltransferase
MMTTHVIRIDPIGTVCKAAAAVWIEIDPRLRDGLLGIEQFSHIEVYYWFHENDTPERRQTLQVHPRHNPANPLTGVFATRSPMRPNLLGHTVCRLIAVQELRLVLEDLDAHDGSPVIDIKGHFPPDIPADQLRVPAWLKRADDESR